MTVTIGLKDRAATHATLVATLTPDRAGFHLYSVDLPAGGIQGVGRPVSVTTRGALTAAGPLTAESAPTTLALEGTGLTLPVYPDGPVTVDLPVTVAEHGEATLLVGYAACSKSVCLPPVSGHPVSLSIS
ncbi:protein-disulfide reductase DsbD family protein [Yinghuangia seranimata]|uniref:protein-disulfide reductase DsbD family protein n=1 Tax=Yinghuangia seranimata TaxID=408067 RepID=UPI00248B4D3E|nr:protein-disulfide reductase DsbD family protein [Yinghuangia seranimata]MDI2129442.1 protein-disulfide reductase DsbD family protein [Yinghuangia seranimata]